MKHTLGLASGFFADPTPEKWRAALAAGFTDAELDFPWKLPPQEMFGNALRTYAILQEAGIRVSSAHLPFGPPCCAAWTQRTTRAATSSNSARTKHPP